MIIMRKLLLSVATISIVSFVLLSNANPAQAASIQPSATQPVQFTFSTQYQSEEAIVTLPKASSGSWWQVHISWTSNQGGRGSHMFQKEFGSVHLYALLPNKQDTCGVQHPQGSCEWTVKVTILTGPPRHPAYQKPFIDTYSA